MKLPLLSISVFGLCSAVALSTAEAQLGKPEGLYYKSWAIIIGIENYVLAPPIPGAISDAKKVAEAFRRLGFDEVVEFYDKDASARRLHQLLNDMLPRKVGRMDRLVLFYVGHAGFMQDSDGQDRGYLVPFDAPVNNATKSITVEHLKEFTRRSASKHTLLLLDAPVFGWETTELSGLSLEGRLAPESDTERRAVYVMSAAGKGEAAVRIEKSSRFVEALLAGLSGSADLDGNGWLMASELGAYLARQVEGASAGTQRPSSLRIDGDGDIVLVEGRKAAMTRGADPRTFSERQQEAKTHYERAVALLQEGKSAEEALERLDRAIGYDPTYGDAYVLKSYVRLEVVPNLDEALATGLLAVKYAPDNADSFYTLGLIHEKRGEFAEAETALRQAVHVNSTYQDVYFALGTLYADHLNDQPRSVEAFRRYLELGGTHARARATVSAADHRPMP
ncbi:MAG: tetratricopeptide repeat protein [Nitrospira sp.]|nr:tetratricopeptide repeat protein [Nitrospira sp.]